MSKYLNSFKLIPSLVFDLIKIFFASLLIFLTIDLIFGNFIYKKFIRKNFVDTYQQIYLKNSYDHTLKKELMFFMAILDTNYVQIKMVSELFVTI